MLLSECQWQTHGDPVLVKMANAAAEFCGHVKNGEPRWVPHLDALGRPTGKHQLSAVSNPRWLSFVGSSGTGKTYLAKGILRWCERRYRVGWAECKHWPTFMGKMRTPRCNVHAAIAELGGVKLLLLDEIGMGADNRDFGIDLLLRVMEQRTRGWTLFTSNATLPQLAAVDGRIASRLVRHGDVVECKTKDYALRNREARGA